MIFICIVNLLSFDLNLLKVLDALLRDASTVRAGERIGLSQPAVSAALKRLRLAFDDPLFVRHGQRLVPTEYARSLEMPVRDLLDRTDVLIRGPEAFDPATTTRRFHLSTSDFFTEVFIPDLAQHFVTVAPGLRFQVLDLVPQDYFGRIEDGDADLALVPNTDFPSWSASKRLFRSPFVVIARAGHPRITQAGLAEDGILPIDLFCDLGHVLFSVEGKLSSFGDSSLEKVGRSRRVVMTLPTFAGVTKAVAGSDLIALVPIQLARRVAPELGLSVYRAPMDMPVPVISMVWHRRQDQDPFHRWMRGVMAGLMEPLDTQA